MSLPGEFDLRAYLERIGCEADAAPTLSSLAAVHAAHLDRIPFENIDVLLKRPVALDLDALQTKLVGNGRGGYCFEQNSLFAAALRALGYEVQTLEARVRPPGATGLLPRTHMVLCVDVEGRALLADVGFGGDGPLHPIALDGAPSEEAQAVYRVDREDATTHVLRCSANGPWSDLYAFTLTPAMPIDFEVAHHYTSTHPRSPFVQSLTVQRRNARARHILRGRHYVVRSDGRESARDIEPEELGPLLGSVFALRLADEDVRALAKALSGPARD